MLAARVAVSDGYGCGAEYYRNPRVTAGDGRDGNPL
jgi:hypothetical protein